MKILNVLKNVKVLNLLPLLLLRLRALESIFTPKGSNKLGLITTS